MNAVGKKYFTHRNILPRLYQRVLKDKGVDDLEKRKNFEKIIVRIRQIFEAVSSPPLLPYSHLTRKSELQTMLLAVSLEAPFLIVSGTQSLPNPDFFCQYSTLYSLFPGFLLLYQPSRMKKDFWKKVFCFLGHSPIYCVKFFFFFRCIEKSIYL